MLTNSMNNNSKTIDCTTYLDLQNNVCFRPHISYTEEYILVNENENKPGMKPSLVWRLDKIKNQKDFHLTMYCNEVANEAMAVRLASQGQNINSLSRKRVVAEIRIHNWLFEQYNKFIRAENGKFRLSKHHKVHVAHFKYRTTMPHDGSTSWYISAINNHYKTLKENPLCGFSINSLLKDPIVLKALSNHVGFENPPVVKQMVLDIHNRYVKEAKDLLATFDATLHHMLVDVPRLRSIERQSSNNAVAKTNSKSNNGQITASLKNRTGILDKNNNNKGINKNTKELNKAIEDKQKLLAEMAQTYPVKNNVAKKDRYDSYFDILMSEVKLHLDDMLRLKLAMHQKCVSRIYDNVRNIKPLRNENWNEETVKTAVIEIQRYVVMYCALIVSICDRLSIEREILLGTRKHILLPDTVHARIRTFLTPYIDAYTGIMKESIPSFLKKAYTEIKTKIKQESKPQSLEWPQIRQIILEGTVNYFKTKIVSWNNIRGGEMDEGTFMRDIRNSEHSYHDTLRAAVEQCS